ncbi:hypothetical protein LshimejAT787_1202770 [Lyophyllum shimeji]|uniref:Uncharacterized protein n=1 Tax=Lyophyllum shimeji TaxID=47721 RepID=A0A9P3PWE6_LYOSH|nr:hypothetical protein LshimejAT787_1202770 [Lyophyllum shimeji]
MRTSIVLSALALFASVVSAGPASGYGRRAHSQSVETRDADRIRIARELLDTLELMERSELERRASHAKSSQPRPPSPRPASFTLDCSAIHEQWGEWGHNVCAENYHCSPSGRMVVISGKTPNERMGRLCTSKCTCAHAA